MKLVIRVVCCIGIVGFATFASGTPIPVLNVLALAKNADLIVVGQIVSVDLKKTGSIELAGQTIKTQIMYGEMRVDQIIKGSADSSVVDFTFQLPYDAVGYKSVYPSTYRIMFFDKTPSGYSFTSPYYPSLCAVPGERVNGTEMLDNLSNELRAVVESTKASFQQKQEAINALRTLPIPAATAAL
jgi:hypothetical protein